MAPSPRQETFEWGVFLYDIARAKAEAAARPHEQGSLQIASERARPAPRPTGGDGNSSISYRCDWTRVVGWFARAGSS